MMYKIYRYFCYIILIKLLTMKKNYILAKVFAFALFIGAANTSNAQYFQENFSNGFNGNWAFLNADGLTPNPGSSFAAVMGTNAWVVFDENGLVNAYNDTAAIANSWYNPAGASDDWMWTVNAIDLSTATAPRLDWTAYSNSAGFLEDYEVYVDTVNTNFGPATTLTPVFTITNGENLTETSRFADLTAFAGKSTVFIAFRQVSNDDDILVIDDIIVAEAPTDPNMLITAIPVQYTSYPLSQVVNIVGSANLENIGGDATGATVTVNVYDLAGPSLVHTETSAAFNIASATDLDYTGFTGYVPTTVGDYAVEMIASITETDSDPSNDTTFYIVQVDDSVYARDRANLGATMSLAGLGTGQGGQCGNMFNVLVQDTITGIQAFISNQNGALNGTNLIANLYSWNGTTASLLASTTPVALDSAINKNTLHDLVFVGGQQILTPGMYIVSVQEGATNASIGTTPGIYTPGGILVDATGFTTGFVEQATVYAGPFVWVIRAVFGTTDTPTSIQELTSNSWSVYPNPAVNTVAVKDAVIGSTIEIFNNLGQLVYSEIARSNNVTINIADFTNGVYTIKNTSNDNVSSQSIVKQ